MFLLRVTLSNKTALDVRTLCMLLYTDQGFATCSSDGPAELITFQHAAAEHTQLPDSSQDLVSAVP